jgi:DNA-binding NtrC family response regulator
VSDPSTLSLLPPEPRKVRALAVAVTAGFDRGAEARVDDGALTVGSGEAASLRLTDPTVSRYHVEFEACADGVVIRDLRSTNGTRVAGMRVREVVVAGPTEVQVGRTTLRLTAGDERALPPSAGPRAYGRLLGASAPIQAVYARLERAAPTTVPVLITGESGTGKELAARALHETSPRAQGAFEVVDCGGLPPTLIESELFGHERGAFTGAVGEREGAFERADGGTVFLDELGELPLELQPKLLRVLAEGEVRRVGASRVRKVDVRLVAATNRDLRVEVNAARFRADLYYRLAVINVRMPALRERLDDLAILVPALLERIHRERRLARPREPDAALYENLARYAWPGNVRELRNYLEQWAVMEGADAPGDELAAVGARGAEVDFSEYLALPIRDAKAQLLERFENAYVRLMLGETRGNVAEAARRSGIDRRSLFRTIRRLGLRDDQE